MGPPPSRMLAASACMGGAAFLSFAGWAATGGNVLSMIAAVFFVTAAAVYGAQAVRAVGGLPHLPRHSGGGPA